MAFMIAQRAFIKVYLITLVEQHKGYGYQMLEDLRRDFKAHGYSPPRVRYTVPCMSWCSKGFCTVPSSSRGMIPRSIFRKSSFITSRQTGRRKPSCTKTSENRSGPLFRHPKQSGRR